MSLSIIYAMRMTPNYTTVKLVWYIIFFSKPNLGNHDLFTDKYKKKKKRKCKKKKKSNQFAEVTELSEIINKLLIEPSFGLCF